VSGVLSKIDRTELHLRNDAAENQDEIREAVAKIMELRQQKWTADGVSGVLKLDVVCLHNSSYACYSLC
jgi:hypothetical protein